jgi:hypothetical protein
MSTGEKKKRRKTLKLGSKRERKMGRILAV